MFAFGEKVVVNDPTLKSHNKIGLFVGMSQRGQAKVYLEEPMLCKKTTVSCITIAVEKLNHYAESERDRILDRLDFLTKREGELQAELTAISDEMFDLEVKLMGIRG